MGIYLLKNRYEPYSQNWYRLTPWLTNYIGCVPSLTYAGEATRSVGTDSISVTDFRISSTLINICMKNRGLC